METFTKQVLEFDNVKVSERKDGIILISLKEDKIFSEIDLLDAAAALQLICSKTKQPVLFDLRNVSKGALSIMNYTLSSDKSEKFVAGVAFLVSSKKRKVVGNINIKLRKPFHDFKVFTDVIEAVDWLCNLVRLHINEQDIELN